MNVRFCSKRFPQIHNPSEESIISVHTVKDAETVVEIRLEFQTNGFDSQVVSLEVDVFWFGDVDLTSLVVIDSCEVILPVVDSDSHVITVRHQLKTLQRCLEIWTLRNRLILLIELVLEVVFQIVLIHGCDFLFEDARHHPLSRFD